jgi:hypothetical protein
MHMSTSPFRKCDYCRNTANSDPLEPRLARRAWTIFHATRKLACPRCWQKGHQEDARLRLLLARNHGLLSRRLLADPPIAYGSQLKLHYLRIKEKYPDALLLFRQDDLYHGFGEDADTLCRVLGLARIARERLHGPFDREAQFPYPALENYLPALVKAGYRVAVCDKVDGPPVPGVVREPAMQYRKSPSRTERYLANDRRLVLERLADLETVLRRHKALPDYAACENRWQKEAEDQRAAEALLLAHEAIALEMRLRNAELKGDSIQCNLGRTRCLFTVASLPALIKEYRRLSRKAA